MFGCCRACSVSGGDHGVARGVRRVDDPAAAMAALARQVEAQFGLRVAREGHAPVDQPLDGFPPMLHDEARRPFVAQAGAGDQRVLRVFVVAVAGVEHRSDAALGPVAGAVRHGALAEDDNPVAIGQLQRDGEAGQPAADDCDVEVHGAGFARNECASGKAGKCTPAYGFTAAPALVG